MCSLSDKHVEPMSEQEEELRGDEEAFRDRIATVNEDGKRIWVFPKKPKGRYYNKRKIVSYILLIVLFGAPHLKINGEQSLLFNILERKFVLFGKVFWPQDLYLFAIAMVIGVVLIIIFTTVFYLVFTKLREQVCTTICPYGRLQGVLLDENSLNVSYDHKRGEGRGKFKKNEDRLWTNPATKQATVNDGE
jgi:polyferredoxin